MPDKKEYEENRGFATEPETWPGIICETNEELVNELKKLNEDRCRNIAEKHLACFGSYEKGDATKQIVNRIIKFIDYQEGKIQ